MSIPFPPCESIREGDACRGTSHWRGAKPLTPGPSPGGRGRIPTSSSDPHSVNSLGQVGLAKRNPTSEARCSGCQVIDTSPLSSAEGGQIASATHASHLSTVRRLLGTGWRERGQQPRVEGIERTARQAFRGRPQLADVVDQRGAPGRAPEHRLPGGPVGDGQPVVDRAGRSGCGCAAGARGPRCGPRCARRRPPGSTRSRSSARGRPDPAEATHDPDLPKRKAGARPCVASRPRAASNARGQGPVGRRFGSTRRDRRRESNSRERGRPARSNDGGHPAGRPLRASGPGGRDARAPRGALARILP